MITVACVVATLVGVASPPTAKPDAPPLELVGPVTRAEVEKKIDGWREAREAAEPNAEAAKKLAKVPQGATVEVYFGTWCGDSRRELSRLWKAVSLAGPSVPFTLRTVAVPRDKTHRRYPEGTTVTQVPSFIVKRGGKEVGRVVETSPNGIENDLLALLVGERSGVISTRTDL
jgi:hypothetical protein